MPNSNDNSINEYQQTKRIRGVAVFSEDSRWMPKANGLDMFFKKVVAIGVGPLTRYVLPDHQSPPSEVV
ncbi:hypothetical protein [Paraburkholderia sp. BL23I1N1]|uniref:hypothetical protein n=1 Tax=Paraburkholderia sp. BL23I1N1 TaxID=1938802 RepID=UPI0011C3C975|nr:hypothetical protein [Paraburkholderia sp. BL23I1N1]